MHDTHLEWFVTRFQYKFMLLTKGTVILLREHIWPVKVMQQVYELVAMFK